MADKEGNNMVTIGGLWKSTSKNGLSYLSGNLGWAKIFIFAVKDKRTENSPDYTICIAEKKGDENAE